MRVDPTLDFEISLLSRDCRLVAGLDEAGRGAWAGPVVAAAVVLPAGDPVCAGLLLGVRDSKQLSPKRREELLPVVREVALAVGVGSVSAAEIDAIGIVPSTRQAMRNALKSLGIVPDHLLIDALCLPSVDLPQLAIIKGDAKSYSIAAASIVAKVTRDRWMIEADAWYPGYGFAQHKGYGTRQHRQGLADSGPCPIHRMSFSPLRAWQQSE
jgi:ribonuclease HII